MQRTADVLCLSLDCGGDQLSAGNREPGAARGSASSPLQRPVSQHIYTVHRGQTFYPPCFLSRTRGGHLTFRAT